MTPQAALALAEERGVVLSARDGKLILKGKAARELAPLLAPLKPALLEHLQGQGTGKVLPFILPPPDARALLGHCTRVRPDTSVTEADVEALAAYFGTLPKEKAIEAERRLWPWWKAAPAPTVGEFLAREPRAKGGAA
jgi:hypothetical protein